jgi:hypothetical protein
MTAFNLTVPQATSGLRYQLAQAPPLAPLPPLTLPNDEAPGRSFPPDSWPSETPTNTLPVEQPSGSGRDGMSPPQSQVLRTVFDPGATPHNGDAIRYRVKRLVHDTVRAAASLDKPANLSPTDIKRNRELAMRFSISAQRLKPSLQCTVQTSKLVYQALSQSGVNPGAPHHRHHTELIYNWRNKKIGRIIEVSDLTPEVLDRLKIKEPFVVVAKKSDGDEHVMVGSRPPDDWKIKGIALWGGTGGGFVPNASVNPLRNQPHFRLQEVIDPADASHINHGPVWGNNPDNPYHDTQKWTILAID